MKIKPNYLYRVLGDLQKQGRSQQAGPQVPPEEKLSNAAAAPPDLPDASLNAPR